jgi:hypothetical protein
MANVMAAASMMIIMVLYSLPQQRAALDLVSSRMRKIASSTLKRCWLHHSSVVHEAGIQGRARTCRPTRLFEEKV